MNYNNTLPDFETLIEKLKPDLQKVEHFRRRKWKKTFLLTLLLVGILAIFYGIDRTYFFHKQYVVFTLAFYACAIILWGVICIQSEKVGIEYKWRIVFSFAKNILKNGLFDPESGIPEKDFINSHLFPKPDKYSAEELVTGQLGDVKIAFSEVRAEQQVVSNSIKNPTRKYYKHIFNGFVFTAAFPREFKNNIVIRRSEILPSQENRVYAEDSVFEKIFNTYCTDPVEAHSVLTPSMMNLIRTLEQKYKNRNIMLSFHDSQFTITITDKTNYFEANIWQSVFNTKKLKREYDLIKAFADIVKELGENEQIWKKQEIA